MQQYLDLLKSIKEKGTYKPPAREGMPGTQSLFGYQFRHNLADGFPLLTTKKVSFKNIVTELLWFLRGDTNIKYLVDNGCNIWNEDAYNYFLKASAKNEMDATKESVPFEMFVDIIKNNTAEQLQSIWSMTNYTLGDCGYQYGRVWRKWNGSTIDDTEGEFEFDLEEGIQVAQQVDQIANIIKSLKETPESRRHIVTAIDPAHDKDLALYWCHAMFQFNCRPLTLRQRVDYINETKRPTQVLYHYMNNEPWSRYDEKVLDHMDNVFNAPKYYLDCELYQRSADVVLGVPYNIASYALLTHILAKICNMIPGEFIHTFGDVHIYDNHVEAVEEQLSREPRVLPTLMIKDEGNDWAAISNLDFNLIEMLDVSDFKLENYNPHPLIKAELSTGLKK